MTGTFDAATHTYAIDGRRVPSVTQIVRRFVPYIAPPGQTAAEADWCRERGTMVHRYCSCVVRGTLDWGSVDHRIEGYVRAAEKWRREVQILPGRYVTETAWFSKLGFGGTPDVASMCTVIEWKTYDDPGAFLQCGGYCLLTGANHAYSVELHEGGEYRATEHDVKRAIGLFRAALSLYQWFESQGLNKKGHTDGE